MQASAFIPMEVKSQNEFHRDRHHHKYNKHRDTWHDAIGFLLGVPENPCTERRSVKIISYRQNPIRDKANFIGGIKPIPDALEKLGWIHNDDRKWSNIVAIPLSGKYPGKDYGTLITVQSLGLMYIFSEFRYDDDLILRVPEPFGVEMIPYKHRFFFEYEPWGIKMIKTYPDEIWYEIPFLVRDLWEKGEIELEKITPIY